MNIKELGTLLLLGALWGASFLFIRIASPVLGPFMLVDLRLLIAGFFLLVYAWIIKKLPDFKSKWKEYLVLGILNAAIPFTLIAYSALHLTASITAILNATTPLFTAIVARFWLKESLSRKKIIGIFIGIAGVAILVGWDPTAFTSTVFLSTCLSLLAAIFYGIGGVYTKRTFKSTPPLALAIWQQIGAGFLLIPLSIANPIGVPVTPIVIFAVIGLAILSTSFGYLLYFDLIANIGPTKTLSVTFLVPLFGIIWGMLFLNEKMSIGTIIGLIMILGSITFITEVRIKRPLKNHFSDPKKE